MLFLHTYNLICGMSPSIQSAREGESKLVARFAERVSALGPLTEPSPALQARLFEEVRMFSRIIDVSGEVGSPVGYGRRVLCESPGRWSLALIILRPGQRTQPHNHGGWGCAVTVQGVERDRRFVHEASGNLTLTGKRDYPPGTGYVFDAVDIHQPVGSDPRRVTVALHFLVERPPDRTIPHHTCDGIVQTPEVR